MYTKNNLILSRFGDTLFLGEFDEIDNKFIYFNGVNKKLTKDFLETIEKAFTQPPFVITYPMAFPVDNILYTVNVKNPPTNPLPELKKDEKKTTKV